MVLLAGRVVLHGLDAVFLEPVLVHHEAAGEVVGVDRRRRLQPDFDGKIVDGGYAFHIGVHRAHEGFVGARAVDREDHVLGGEVGTVVKFHARAKLEHPYIGVALLEPPFGGEARHDLTVVGGVDQRLVDVVHEVAGDRLIDRMRVERQRIRDACPADRLGRGCRRAECGNGCREN